MLEHKPLLVEMLRRMVRIRLFEERVIQMVERGEIVGARSRLRRASRELCQRRWASGERSTRGNDQSTHRPHGWRRTVRAFTSAAMMRTLPNGRASNAHEERGRKGLECTDLDSREHHEDRTIAIRQNRKAQTMASCRLASLYRGLAE